MDVLVVDDNAPLRAAVSRALRHTGLTVTAVPNPLEAFTAIAGQTPGVILCDIRMPLLDGIRFYQALADEHPMLAHRFVFMSAYTEDTDVQSFVARTGRPLLRKPFDLDQLFRMVSTIGARVSMSAEPVLGMRRQDREIGRHLPDEFLALPGSPSQRAAELVNRHWATSSPADQRQLAQVLTIWLGPLIEERKRVSDALRDECGDLVAAWIARQ